jgi:hypothetical protein
MARYNLTKEINFLFRTKNQTLKKTDTGATGGRYKMRLHTLCTGRRKM